MREYDAPQAEVVNFDRDYVKATVTSIDKTTPGITGVTDVIDVFDK